VFWSFLYLILGHVLRFLVLLVRGERSKELEILALRHQVTVKGVNIRLRGRELR
jgi:hypothetical protein